MRRCVFVLCLMAVCPLALPAADGELGALIDANRWRKARPLSEAAVKANANDADAAYQLGRIKMQFNDLDGALPLA